MTKSSARDALIASFLGWTLDAFDFFILTFVLASVAKEFGKPIPALALTLTASLAMRPVGAVIFGLMADRYGRRLPLMLSIIFYSAISALSGLAPTYTVFFFLRLLYGIGMGGEWGVGASLAMEAAPKHRRGIVSGFLQEGYACGFLLAAVAYGLIFPRYGWRPLFFLGGLPALLTLFIRARVEESDSWKESRLDWSSYQRTLLANAPRFAYLVLLMTMMNFISHGTQDLYPTFLQQQRHFKPSETATISVISMVGAILGGLTFGHFSDRWGRRRAMVSAVLGAFLLVPLWILVRDPVLIALGAFSLQFLVQGAWGIVPAHINELSPGGTRGFFPGFAYQLGVLCASWIGYVEALLAHRFGYAGAIGAVAVSVLAVGAIVIALGPEAHRTEFSSRA